MILEIGAGPHSTADYQIDIAQFPHTTHVVDVAVEPLPFADNSIEQIIANQVLEHIETIIHYKEDGKWHRRYPRVELLKEIYRVLIPGGTLKASVPTEWPFWAQDPTHVDVPWVPNTFAYFCGGWGANTPGDFAYEAYGIDFAFQMGPTVKGEQDFFNTYITLTKPQ